MHTLQVKLLTYITLICIVPVSILGILYYNTMINSMEDKLDLSSREVLEQMDKNITVKTTSVQKKVDKLFQNHDFYEIIQAFDFTEFNANTYDAHTKLDRIMSDCFHDEPELNNIILFPQNGGMYTYQEHTMDTLISFSVKYGKIEAEHGQVVWLGSQNIKTGSADSSIIAGATMQTDDGTTLCTLYLSFNQEYFEREMTNNSDYIQLIIYNEWGKQVFTCGENLLNELWEVSIMLGREIYENDQGKIRIDLEGNDTLLIFTTSKQTGWRYIRAVQYTKYFEQAIYVKRWTLIIVFFILFVTCALNFFFVRHITAPVRELVGAMRQFSSKDFDVTLNIHSKDEFSAISKGFNEMVTQIKALFLQVVHEEKKRKKADILALQYQMNPHFLFNTIGAIRMLALYKKQNDISEMLLILGRFLRRTIHNANAKISIEDEIQNLKDYISLYQIRHDNLLSVRFEVADDMKQQQIHSMLLQPIVENSILHGLNDKLAKGKPAELLIRIFGENGKMNIFIRDNGKGMTREQIAQLLQESEDMAPLHVGIKNVCNRLRLIYGDRSSFDIQSELESYTEVRLILTMDNETTNKNPER